MNRKSILFQLFLVIIYSLLQNDLSAQGLYSTFKLNGSITANVGSVVLIPIGDSSYYPNKLDSQEIIVSNGSFIIENVIAYPYSVRIGYRNEGKWQYISGPFFVNSGEQDLVCHSDSLWETPNILNNSMEEWQGRYTVSHRNSQDTDSILLAYTTTYPDSYISLWELVNSFTKGYKPIHDSIFVRLSSLLKNNYTGKQLETKIKAAKLSSVGSLFSFRPLQNEKLKKTSFENFEFRRLTLIDFWFSHCIPCISQFERLEELRKGIRLRVFR